MKAVELIAAKRDGRELSTGELEWLVTGFTNGYIPDYQVSAWLMSVYFRGMTSRETADLTRAMVASGRRLDLSSVAPFIADKHSTGGVGDKTTLVVAPLVAAAGVPVGKMSGRGLGFSGGTIDKLESIPGFRTQLPADEFASALGDVGLVIASQTSDLAPADGRLYALRDVTATIESIPLIASSIMSKKIAAGASAVVLDVKVGKGAFMKSPEEAVALASAMRDIGVSVGMQVRAVLSGMDQPLGYAVGNALEIEEAVRTLRGDGPEDLLEVALVLGSQLLLMAGVAATDGEARSILLRQIENGAALSKFRDFVVRQGGDPAFIDDPLALPHAPIRSDLAAADGGYITAIDAEEIGKASVDVGAGRAVKGAEIDHSVGFILAVKIGDRVSAGERLLTVHARTRESADEAVERLAGAFTVSSSPVEPPPAVLEII